MYSTDSVVPVLLDVSRVFEDDNASLSVCSEVVIDSVGLVDSVSFESPVNVKGTVENSAGYVKLTLEFELVYDTECARCLSAVHGVRECCIEKTLCRAGTLEDEEAEDVILDYVIIENDMLDLTSLIEEYAILEFPSVVLCKEDCKGLCPKCGKNLNLGECSCPKKEIDPRMEVFRDLLESYNKSSEED